MHRALVLFGAVAAIAGCGEKAAPAPPVPEGVGVMPITVPMPGGESWTLRTRPPDEAEREDTAWCFELAPAGTRACVETRRLRPLHESYVSFHCDKSAIVVFGRMQTSIVRVVSPAAYVSHAVRGRPKRRREFAGTAFALPLVEDDLPGRVSFRTRSGRTVDDFVVPPVCAEGSESGVVPIGPGD